MTEDVTTVGRGSRTEDHVCDGGAGTGLLGGGDSGRKAVWVTGCSGCYPTGENATVELASAAPRRARGAGGRDPAVTAPTGLPPGAGSRALLLDADHCSALTGRFGRRVGYWGDCVVGEGHAHLLATDAHHPQRRPPLMTEPREAAAALIGSEQAMHLVQTRPAMILRDLPPERAAPLPQGVSGAGVTVLRRLAWLRDRLRPKASGA